MYFMQAGFAMCEAGFTRAKNTGNILMKNLMDFCIGTPCFWLVGFGLMFGAGSALIGRLDPLILGDYSHILPAGVPQWAYVIFQTVFCATSATIVSGSMAERTKFSAYCVYSACISLFLYPISGHWIWGGGWLAQLGFHDFAGSTAVHMVGGICACIGAAMLGPRIGKYDSEGKPRAIVQISHGICEYVERYAPFAEYLAEHGFLVVGNDHLGHGGSAPMAEKLGWFAEWDGWTHASNDTRTLQILTMRRFPGLPYFLFGHSMGSMIARLYLSKHADLLAGVEMPEGGFDFVCANIVADIIVRMAPDIAKYMRDGGLLAVSGIIDTQADRVRRALEDGGLTLVRVTAENDWKAMLFARLFVAK